jgi:hypothetical protein
MSSNDPSAPDGPAIAAEVERAIQPYRAVVPPDLVASVRARLEQALGRHPVAASILAQWREAEQQAAPADLSAPGGHDGAVARGPVRVP